jgi:hypothetical protein
MFDVARDKHFYIGEDAFIAIHPSDMVPVLVRRNGGLSKERIQYLLDTTKMDLDENRGIGYTGEGKVFYYLKKRGN